MDKGIVITAIICGTVALASVLNFVKWAVDRKTPNNKAPEKAIIEN